MTKKDQHRLAPHHSHYFEARTSMTLNHRHMLRVYVFPVNGSSTDGHFHTYKGITFTDNGHLHRIEGVTGPPIPFPNGSHYHVILGKTKDQPFIHQGNIHYPATYPIHDHEYKGTTGIEIGYEPSWW